MFRSSVSLLALCAALAVSPVVAADYGSTDDMSLPGMRDSYTTDPSNWTELGDQTDPLRFEFGLRYWYSMGAADWSDAAGTFSTTDSSHSLEGHLRIEDHSTNTYAAALAGYAFRTTGTYTDPFESGSVVDGKLSYMGADLGWNSWGNGAGSGIGPMVGYMYWNDSPNTNRGGYTTASSAADIGWDTVTGQTSVPMGSKDNNIDIHMLRLGVQGKGDMGFFDVTGTLAAVPYAKISGILGNDQTTTLLDHSVYAPGNIASIKASPTSIDGWGYGAMADVMLRAHPTDHWTIGVGGRAWYLQGTADATFDQATIGNPSDSDANGSYDVGPTFSKHHFIELANPFRVIRYGVLAEATYAF